MSDQTAVLTWSTFPVGTRFEVEYRIKNSTTTLGSFTTTLTTVSIGGLTPNTAYEYRVRVLCDATTASAFTNYSSFTTLSPCTAMYSIRAGSWDNYTTWSCNRVPNRNDVVEIRHPISLVNGGFSAQKIRYATGGRLIHSTGTKLQLGF